MSLKKLGFGIKISTLDCGLNVITKEFPGNFVVSGLAVRSGSVYDPPQKNGLAHLTEHCIFDGARAEAVTEQLPLISDHHVNLIVEREGAVLNGLNSYQSVTYVLDFNKRDPELMLNLLLRVVMLPKLSDASIDYQKNIVCAELARDMENPLYGDTNSTFFDELLRSYLFARHPIGKMCGGKIEEVITITPKLVREAFTNFYAPNNMALIVLGPLTHSYVVNLARKFEKDVGHLLPGKIKKIPKLDPSVLLEEKLQKEVQVWSGEHFRHAVINMGYRAPNILHRDNIPIRILSGLLGGFTWSRLYHSFRERMGYSYFAESRYFRTTIHGEFVIHANFHPKPDEKIRDVLNATQDFVRKELKNIKNGDLGQEEFEQAKRSLYNYDRKFGMQNQEYVRNLLVDAFSSNNYNNGGSITESITAELNSVVRIKNCSFKRFISAVNRQIDPERYVLLISGPPGCY